MKIRKTDQISKGGSVSKKGGSPKAAKPKGNYHQPVEDIVVLSTEALMASASDEKIDAVKAVASVDYDGHSNIPDPYATSQAIIESELGILRDNGDNGSI
ncbi:MAG: hypothetical protein JXR91_10175 [Deltaproteobacteria bacterium]|nr:hypothetical protein [Deltaproteobacteria bacterium]